MKKYFYALIIISIVHCTMKIEDCNCQWQVISSSGNTAVNFPSVNTGYSTSNGLTLKSTNGGYNWSALSGGNLTGIFFINDLTGWVVGYPGYIGKTTNGSSFVQQPTGIQDRLNDVFFINDNTGWVVGGDFSVERIFKTTNGGSNWDVQTSSTANKLFSVYFVNEYTGWCVGGPSSPKIIKTTNGGTNWFTQNTSVTTPLYSVMFANANTGWAVSGYLGGETIIKTTDGGNNWFSQSSGDNRYLRECYVLDSLKVIAVGQGGKIIATTNGGLNWSVIITGSSVELWSIDFPNNITGYATGTTAVLKTTNGGVTFNSESISEVPSSFSLSQNYPNPFNQSSIINFQTSVKGNVSLKIYDISGRELQTLVNENLNAGSYDVRFDGSSLSSGVYYYILNSGDFRETKKMVLIK